MHCTFVRGNFYYQISQNLLIFIWKIFSLFLSSRLLALYASLFGVVMELKVLPEKKRIEGSQIIYHVSVIRDDFLRIFLLPP